MKKLGIFLTFAFLASFLAICCSNTDNPGAPAADAASPSTSAPAAVEPGEKIAVELWVMSECPFGKGAENAVKNLMDVLGPRIDLSIHFILDDPGDGTFESLHGQPEVDLNRIQACAGIVAPDKMIDFIVADNKSEASWQEDAAGLALDVPAIEKCLKEGGADAILAKDAKIGDERGISSSPTLFIEGQKYEGPRGSLDLFKRLCRRMGDAKPSVCDTAPETLSQTDAGAGSGSCGDAQAPKIPDELVDKTPFTHTVIFASNAFSSMVDRVLEQTTQYYPEAKIEKVDSETKQGKELIKKYGIEWLPAYIFPTEIEKTKNFQQLKAVMKKTRDGSAYMLNPKQVGSNINLSRPYKEGELKIFYSPFAPNSLELIKATYDLLKNPAFAKAKSLKITFVPRALIDRGGAISAQGGIPEVEAIQRHAAILKAFPDKYEAFVAARAAQPLSSYWEEFIQTAGMKPDEVKKIARSSQIQAKLIADAKEADTVNANPMFAVLVENREVAEVRDKEDMTEIIEKLIQK